MTTNAPDEAPVSISDLERYVLLTQALESIETERKALGDKLKEQIPADSKFVAPSDRYGTLIVERGTQNRLLKGATERIARDYPQATHPLYWKPVIDVSAIPEALVTPYRSEVVTLSVKALTEEAVSKPRRSAE